jgi:hemoglobin-like flavoprotein
MERRHIDLVRTSHAHLAAQVDAFGNEFHDCLLALAPSLAPLCDGVPATRNARLMRAITDVIATLDDRRALLAHCAALIDGDAGVEIEEAHYDDVGMALLKALHAGLGTHYTEGVEEAWASVYGEIAEALIVTA